MPLALAKRILTAVGPTPTRAAHLFVVANIAFLGVDIAIAHLANDFAHRGEWAPVIFSLVATPLLLPGAFGSRRPIFHWIDRGVAYAAMVVGIAGMVFHLESGFFEQQTLHDLVYSAPFVAPIAYVGVGLLLLLLRSEEAVTPRLGGWILLLALGGFIGNLGLSLLDHAQNGFFHATEWIPVVSAAYGVGFLAVAVAQAPLPSRAVVRACAIVMGAQVLVGLVGTGLHVEANLHRSVMTTMRDRFVFGAPAFAPLLFANLALLAWIGLWACSLERGGAEAEPESRPEPAPAPEPAPESGGAAAAEGGEGDDGEGDRG